jgi:hypothetical protein
VSFDQLIGRNEDDEKIYLKDVIAGSDPREFVGSDPDVDKLRRAIDAELPFFSDAERKTLEWKLAPDGGKLTHWAAKNGFSKGYASKLNQRITTRLANRMKGQP